MTVGTHGTTYGGNPLATSIGNAVLDVVLAPGFLARVGWLGLRLKQGLAGLQARHGGIIAGFAAKGSDARHRLAYSGQ